MIEAISGLTPVPSATTERQAAPAAQPAAASDNTALGMSPESVRAIESAMRAQEPPLMGHNERLSIIRDEETGTFIYRSVDRETGKVTRQWPVESMLQFKAYIREYAGLAVDRRA